MTDIAGCRSVWWGPATATQLTIGLKLSIYLRVLLNKDEIIHILKVKCMLKCFAESGPKYINHQTVTLRKQWKAVIQFLDRLSYFSYISPYLSLISSRRRFIKLQFPKKDNVHCYLIVIQIASCSPKHVFEHIIKQTGDLRLASWNTVGCRCHNFIFFLVGRFFCC